LRLIFNRDQKNSSQLMYSALIVALTAINLQSYFKGLNRKCVETTIEQKQIF